MIHLVANSHIDPVWLWDKYEGVDEVLNTFRSAADRLDEYPDLRFTAGSIQFYEWVRDYDSELFDRIVRHARNGRWEIIGGFWIEPDTNLPSRSSFEMHRRLSDDFTSNYRLPATSTVAYVPDTFGHPADLPAILADLGFESFIFCRPGLHEKPDLPAGLFYWEYAGARVLAYRLKYHYLQPQPDGNEAQIRDRLSDPEIAEAQASAFFFGMGDHGGGPTIREIEFYRRYMAETSSDIRFSTCAEFFRAAREVPDIPTYTGDLHMHAVGCYSVMRDIKSSLRTAERNLSRCARIVQQTGRDGTGPDGGEAAVRSAWKRVVFNEFHDILPGSCAPRAAANALDEIAEANGSARDVAYAGMKRASRAIGTECMSGEFRIYNSLSRPVTVPLAVESFHYYRQGAPFKSVSGGTLEIQEVLPSVRAVNRRWTFVDTLPAAGFKRYYFDDDCADPPARPSTPWPHFEPGDSIETDRGHVGSDGVSYGGTGGGRVRLSWLVLRDASDTWGHGVRSYNDVAGSLSLLRSAVSVGPVVRSLRQLFTWKSSSMEVVWSAYRRIPGVYVDITVRWAEVKNILKMELADDAFSDSTFEMQGAYGPIDRAAAGDEVPLHGWIRAKRGDNRAGCALLQDGAFAADCAPGRLRITLVRSCHYAHHDPFPLSDSDPARFTDQGTHTFSMLLLPESMETPTELDERHEELVEDFSVIRESGS